MAFSHLELHWRSRAGGGGRTERRYLDFMIDGTSLMNRLGDSDEQVGILGCWSEDSERDSVRRLLSAAGRVPLYVCAECGDPGCGAITALVERQLDEVVWRDFAFENTTNAVPDSYRGIGPFRFNKTEYWQVLSDRLSQRK